MSGETDSREHGIAIRRALRENKNYAKERGQKKYRAANDVNDM